MRVALYEPFGGGGIFHYTFELAEGLARQGATVTVFTRPDYELADLPRDFEICGQLERSHIKKWLDGLAARLRPRRSPSLPSQASSNGGDAGAAVAGQHHRISARQFILWLEFIGACLRRRTQVVHVQWVFDPERDYHLLRILKRLRFRVVYTAHNALPHDSESAAERLSFHRIYELVDRIIVHAEHNRQELAGELGVDPRKIAVIPHGAYDLFYRNTALTREQARDALGLPRDRKIVLFFGGIRRYKGLEYLVEAFRKAKQKVEGLQLLVVGKVVKTADADDFVYYSKLLDELSTEEDVICRSGYVPFEQVPWYFSASDLVALPYVKTYQSGILALAYAAGRPVVVSDTGGLAEVVEIGKSGLVVPPCDPDRLADAIIEMVSDPARIDTMGSHAKHLAETKYSWDDIAVRTLAVYAEKRGPVTPN